MNLEEFKGKYGYVEMPYYKSKHGINDAISNALSRNEKNKILFIFHKFKIHILGLLAYFCPLNSIRVRFHKWRGVHIGRNVQLGMFCILDNSYPEYIFIDDEVSLAQSITIITHSNPYEHFKNSLTSYRAPVVIGKGTWIGLRATILPGVEIGNYSILTAGSVAQNNIPQNVVAHGNPAKMVSKITI